MKIEDLFDVNLLAEMLAEGYVRMRHHPTLPYYILNYTEKAAYESVWNDVTLNCRGLIVDNTTGEIIARPFPKFFNYGQTGAAEIALDEAVRVTDKMDGSLGIIYPSRGGWAVATRGSFESEQAIHATELLQKYHGGFISSAVTFLVEIVYPENRIVLDYGDMDELVLLGGIHIETGNIVDADTMNWSGPRTKSFSYETFADALAAEPRKNAEGYVIRTWDNRMLKIKQIDYQILHRIVTGLSEKTVWEAMQKGDAAFQDLASAVPDEFYSWISQAYEKFANLYRDLSDEVEDLFDQICWYFNLIGWEEISARQDLVPRRDLAEQVMKADSHLRPMLFNRWDNKPIDDMIWKLIKPVGVNPMKRISEDVA